MGSGNSRLGETKKADSGLGFDDHLERVRINSVGEGSIGIKNAVELKAMRNQELGINLVRQKVLSSIGVLTVSTNRVVMLMFRSQRRSKWSAACLP